MNHNTNEGTVSTPSPDRTEPSAEAIKAASASIDDWYEQLRAGRNGGMIDWKKHFALALDRFRAAGVREWQPIETAPKDGTVVDLLNRSGTRITNARYRVEPKRDLLPAFLDG